MADVLMIVIYMKRSLPRPRATETLSVCPSGVFCRLDASEKCLMFMLGESRGAENSKHEGERWTKKNNASEPNGKGMRCSSLLEEREWRGKIEQKWCDDKNG